MSPTATALSAYAQASVATASPHEVVRMAYERILTACDRATSAAGDTPRGWIQTFHDETVRAQAILTELMTMLAVDSPEDAVADLSAQLDELYRYCVAQLVQANMSKSAEPLPAVRMVIDGLRSAWVEMV